MKSNFAKKRTGILSVVIICTFIINMIVSCFISKVSCSHMQFEITKHTCLFWPKFLFCCWHSFSTICYAILFMYIIKKKFCTWYICMHLYFSGQQAYCAKVLCIFANRKHGCTSGISARSLVNLGVSGTA